MQPKNLAAPHLPGLESTTCICCGGRYSTCPHYGTHAYNIDPEHRDRIKARYALAARFAGEPFEETAIATLRAVSSGTLGSARSYADDGFVPIRVPRKLNGDLLANEREVVD